MNIQFSYLYRDAGNFKNWGEVVFSNPHNVSLDNLSAKTKFALIDEMYFVASAVGVPDLHFDDYKQYLDHDWHEFDGLKEVENLPTDPQERSIETFLSLLAAK